MGPTGKPGGCPSQAPLLAEVRPTASDPLHWPIAIAPAGASARLHNRSRHHREGSAGARHRSGRARETHRSEPRSVTCESTSRSRSIARAASPGKRETRGRCRLVTPPLRVRGACFKALLHRRVLVHVRRCRRVHTPCPSMGFGPPTRRAPRSSLRWSSSDLLAETSPNQAPESARARRDVPVRIRRIRPAASRRA
jgi:hypothetical protein